jgi:hypothetical protein
MEAVCRRGCRILSWRRLCLHIDCDCATYESLLLLPSMCRRTSSPIEPAKIVNKF